MSFLEEMPKLHVISAGFLLEFALEEFVFSMPVDRVEFMYLGPMQFGGFLMAARRQENIWGSQHESGQTALGFGGSTVLLIDSSVMTG